METDEAPEREVAPGKVGPVEVCEVLLLRPADERVPSLNLVEDDLRFRIIVGHVALAGIVEGVLLRQHVQHVDAARVARLIDRRGQQSDASGVCEGLHVAAVDNARLYEGMDCLSACRGRQPPALPFEPRGLHEGVPVR